MKNKANNTVEWVSVEVQPLDGIIKTLHTDGVEDVCMVHKGEIYSYDGKTSAPISYYRYMDHFTYTKFPHPQISKT